MGQFRTLGDNLARKIDLRRLGALAVLTFGSFWVWVALSASGQPQIAASFTSSFRSSNSLDLPAISAADNDARRKVYPYSVIPGGVESAAELRNSVLHDPVVAKHYEDFAVEKTRVVRLNQNRSLYVSYRLGNRVFWSRKPMMLPKGETVITDGEHVARTRCGNRLSEVPAGPILAAGPELESAPEVAELFPALPVPGAPGALGPPELPGLPVPTSTPPTTSGTPPGTLLPPGGGVIVPPIVPVPRGGTTPPPVPTPEPQTLLMLSAGLTGLWLARKKYTR
jgi:hypothetical protein